MVWEKLSLCKTLKFSMPHTQEFPPHFVGKLKNSMFQEGEFSAEGGKKFHLWVEFQGFIFEVSALNARRKKKRCGLPSGKL